MGRIQQLRDLLAQHLPADAREEEFRTRMLEVVERVALPCARSTFEPGHFTASAFVLSPDRGKLLLILHGKLGIWVQPGGHIDPGDLDLRSAALRELIEETGLEGARPSPLAPGLLDVDIHPIPANPRKGEPAHQHLDLRFLFEADTESVQAGSDALDARWLPLDDLDGLATDESVRRAVRKLRSALL